MSGTLFSQGVQFAAALVLARLYSPENFGQYATILAIAAVLGAVIALAYPSAIILAEDDEGSRVLAWLSIVVSSLAAILVSLLLTVGVVLGVRVLGWQPNWQHVFFVPLTAWVIALWGTLQVRQSRLSAFHRIAAATGCGATVQAGTQVGLGWLHAGAPGLSAGYLVGRLVNVGLLARGAHLGRFPGFGRLRQEAARWSEMPRWLLLPTAMNLLGTSAVVPWVARQYGLDVAGSFAFAFQMLSVPAALVGQAVATILFPRMAQDERDAARSSSAVERYAVGLASIAVPVFLPVFILGPQLFSLFFGQRWVEAGQVAAILAPWLAASFVSSPLSSLAVVKRRLRSVAVISSLETIARFGALAVGGVLGSSAVGFILYSAVGVAISTNYVAWTLRLSGGSLLSLLRRHWLWASVVVVGSALLAIVEDRLPAPAAAALTTVLCVALALKSRTVLVERR